MCGITGLLSPVPISAGVVATMNGLVAHRGPDDEGYLVDGEGGVTEFFGSATAGSVLERHRASADMEETISPSSDMTIVGLALGHRRLAIVDLSAAGHQPMCYRGRLWITYNGEIYNFPEIRKELTSLGHCFASQTDTEVILAAYAEWGSGCLHRFNGMWAFAIYDSRDKKLFLARDRFGVKPLYYWVSPSGVLAFGSEIKQFTVLPGWNARVNGQRAYDFLVWGLSDHTDETMFAGVNQLPPGSCATIDTHAWLEGRSCSRSVPVVTWYRFAPRPFRGSFDAAVDSVRELLTDSVALRMHSDVPVGSCLSGGLDSSTIVCLLNMIRRMDGVESPQLTFSARSESARVDEGKWIEEVVRATRLESKSVTPDGRRVFDERRDVVWYQDEPYGSTSIHAQWSVFRLASSERVRVMLDGQGADELFAGYSSYFGAHLAGLLRRGALLEFGVETISAIRNLDMGLRSLALATAHHTFSSRFVKNVARILGRSPFEPNWLDLQRLGATPLDPFVSRGGRSPSVEELSLSHVRHTNLPMLLHWEDRSSMAHSIEARVPFLDYRLAEYVVGLPASYKINRAVTKRVLRDAMKEVLPDKIRTRKDKIGFATAEQAWMQEGLGVRFIEGIDHATKVSNGIVKPEARSIVQDMVRGRTRFSFLPWRIISFGDWLDRFAVKSDGP